MKGRLGIRADTALDINNIFEIFDKQSSNYLQIESIQRWIQQVEPVLSQLTNDQLLEIFHLTVNLRIFDLRFIKNLCNATLEKVSQSNFSYDDLSNILYSLQGIKYNKDINLIQAIATKLTQLEQYSDTKSLSTSIWSLAKLGFYDEVFFRSWIKIATPEIQKFTLGDLLKSIQAIATLKFYDDVFISEWLRKTEAYLNDFNPQTKLNIAFYLSMISVNNFDNNSSTLKEEINSFIKKTINSLDFEFFQDEISKQQIVQIYLARTADIAEEVFRKISSEIKDKSDISTSVIQRKVEGFIKKAYTSFTVVLEQYDQKTAAFVDVTVKRNHDHPEYDVHIQVDGPTHYFVNHQPKDSVVIVNGATEFRNKLHAANSFKPYVISYMDIDSYNYYEGLLNVLNTYPEESQSLIDYEGKTGGTEHKSPGTYSDNSGPNLSGAKASSSKKTKKSPGKKSSKVNDIDDSEFDLLIADFTVENAIELTLEQKFNLIKQNYKIQGKTSSLKRILEKAITAKNIEDIEITLKYQKQTGEDLELSKELNDIFYKMIEERVIYIQTYDDLANAMQGILQERGIYIQIYKAFLSHGYKVQDFTEIHLKALIYVYSLGEVEVFQQLLSLIPESYNKTQLMEYFFINCGVLNHIEIADFLLNNNIDIDSCYSRESVEVLYALAVGKKHNGRVFSEAPEIIKNLYYSLTAPHSLIETTESLLQKAAKGTIDKKDGVPEGRGITALHLSCYDGAKSNEIRLFLLKNHANPNTMQRDNFTPLMTALFLGDESSALQILDFNPNVNLKATNDVTVSSIAATLGFYKVIKKIIDLQGDLETKVTSNFYVQNNDGKKIQFYDGNNPLSIALKYGHISVAESLIDAKVELNDQIIEEVVSSSSAILIGNTLNFKGSILAYCITKYPQLVEKLLENGANVNNKAMPVSPLMLAAELSNSWNRLKKEGNEAFQLAIEYNKYKIFEMLLAYGADINFTDTDGDTVIEYTRSRAIKSDHHKMIELIAQHEKIHGIDIQARYKIILDLGVELDHFPIVSQDSQHQVVADIVKTSIDIEAGCIINFVQLSEPYGLKTPVQKVMNLILPIKLNIESSYIEHSSAVPAITDANDMKTQNPMRAQSSDNAKSNVDLFYKSILGIKILDTSIDMFKSFQEPTFEHFNILARDVTHLSISITGANSYSISFGATDTAAQLYYGEYAQAFIQAGTTAGYALLSALPTILPDVLGIPLDPVYQALSILYISEQADNILNKIDSTYSTYGTPEANLKSNIAYAELNNYLGFKELAKDYCLDAMKIVQEDFALHQNHESFIQQLALKQVLLGDLCKLTVIDSDHYNE
ncbi:MAG: hypothetical protein WBJ81_05795 [Rickettsiales bacterium]